RAGTSIGAPARAPGAGWLLAGGARPGPRPGCPAPGVVQAADSTSSTPSPAVTRVAPGSDLTGQPSHKTVTRHTPKVANGGTPQRAGRSGAGEGGPARMRRRCGAAPPRRARSLGGPALG